MPEVSEVHDSRINGLFGRAVRIPNEDAPHWAATVCSWLIDAPGQHPIWSQYSLCVVRLAEIEGFPEPYLQFEGATHELMEHAISPDHGYQSIATMAEYGGKGTLPILTPANISLQWTSTDSEMEQLAKMACWGVVNGMISAEPPFSRETNEAHWKHVLDETLDHFHGKHEQGEP